MSFASDARQEIIRQNPPDGEAARLELTAAFLLAGSVRFMGGGRYMTSISCDSAAVCRHCFRLMRRVCDLAPTISTVRSNQLGEHVRYQLSCGEAEAHTLLSRLRLLDDAAFLGVRREPPAGDLSREENRIAWLRGAFLTCGWVSNPEKAYSAEFALPDEEQARRLEDILEKMDFHCGISTRKSQYVVYLKDAQGVSRLLATLGAYSACMTVENVRILKQLRGGVNRQTNCDNSNADKIVRAAEKQMEDITYLLETGTLEKLPRPLREIAEARLNNPDANLSELGAMCDPPIGKSGVNNRLRRLGAIAQERRDSQQ